MSERQPPARSDDADVAEGAEPRPRRAYLPAAERRRRIIEAAREVFTRTSLQGARTRDLAKAAEINQATLFGHFASKEELFAVAVVEPMIEMMQGMTRRSEAYQASRTDEEMIALARVSTHRHLDNMEEVYPLLTAAMFGDTALGRELYQERIVPILKQRAEAVRNLVGHTIDPDLFSVATFGIFFAVAMDRAMTGKSGDTKEIADQLTNLMAFGFAEGRKRPDQD